MADPQSGLWRRRLRLGDAEVLAGGLRRPWIYHSIGSTNAHLEALADRGAPSGEVVAAERQWAGRGRRERAWLSSEGSSLAVSVLWRSELGPRWLAWAGLCLAMAASQAAERLARWPLGLKWPNDLVGGDAKLGGVLAQVGPQRDSRSRAVVVGLGLNLAGPLPSGLAGVASDLETVSGVRVGHDEMLSALLESFGARLELLGSAGGRARLAAEYTRRCVTLGRQVRAELDAESIEGIALRVEDSGALVIRRRSGAEVAVLSGDLVHLRALGQPTDTAHRAK